MSRITESQTNTQRPTSTAGNTRIPMPLPFGTATAGFVLIVAIILFAESSSAAAQSTPDFDSGRETEATSVVLFDTLSLTLSESYLYNAAEARVKKKRVLGGTSMAIGIASVALGVTWLSQENDNDFSNLDQELGEYFAVTGSVYIVTGLAMLATTPSPEKKWLRYLPEHHLHSGVADRERTASEALREQADKARNKRIITTLIGTVASLAVLSSSREDITYEAIVLCGISAISLARKSPEERQWENYLRETGRRSRNPVRVGIGLLPDGGGVITARFSL